MQTNQQPSYATVATRAAAPTYKKKIFGPPVKYPAGGDYNDCLSSDEIDAVTLPLCGQRAIEAETLYRVRTGAKSAARTTDLLTARAKEHGYVLAPIHVRYHWACGIFKVNDAGQLTATVIDSAPSKVTHDDIHQLMRRLRVAHTMIISAGRQPHNTNECGVHVVLNMWRTALEQTIEPSLREISLGHLRPELIKLARSFSMQHVLKLVDAAACTQAPHEPAVHVVSPTTVAHSPPVAVERSVMTHNPYAPVLGGVDVWLPGQTIPPAPAAIAPPSYAEAVATLGASATTVIHGGQSSEVPSPAAPQRPQAPHGGTSEVGLEAATSCANQCYIYSAMLALHQTGITAFAKPVSVAQIEKLQKHFGYPLRQVGEAQDALKKLIARTAANVELHFGTTTLMHARSPFVFVFSPNRPVRLPQGYAQVGVIAFMGRIQFNNSGDDFEARHGHYVYRKNGDLLNGAHPVIYALQRVAPPVPDLQLPVGENRFFYTRDSPRPSESLPPALIRSIVKEFRVGQRVIAHWMRNDVSSTWSGVVMQRRDIRVPCTVLWDAEICGECGAYAAIPEREQVELEVPFEKTLYFQLSVEDGPFAPACTCNDVGENDLAELDGEDQGVLLASIANLTPADSAPMRGEPRRTEDRYFPDEELYTNELLGTAPPQARNGAFAMNWFIYSGKPPHMHYITWRRLSPQTRAAHIRWLQLLKAMPRDLLRAPVGHAIVELVLRMAGSRNWVWSTVAGAFATIVSAVKRLEFYTNETKGFDLSSDGILAAAMQRAQSNARTDPRKMISDAMTLQQMEQLSGTAGSDDVVRMPNPRVALLLQTAWAFAGRIGDIRQILPGDVRIGAAHEAGFVTTVTLRAGKCVGIHGPQTLHAVIPTAVAKNLQNLIRELKPDEPLFTKNDQARLSRATRTLGLTLRSVRRGALTLLANSGVSEADLLLLSQHRSVDTLLRYLNWGVDSATRKQAAVTRAEALLTKSTPLGGAAPSDNIDDHAENEQVGVDPPKMGLNSGAHGRKGQRLPSDPEFFPKSACTRQALGLADGVDTSDFQVHIKKVSLVNWHAAREMAHGTILHEQVERAHQLCTTTQFFGPTAQGVDPRKIPYTRMTPQQIELLIDGSKLVPFVGQIHNFAKGWMLPQPVKKRWRPIFEPEDNKHIDLESLVHLSYPTRLERRAVARNAIFEAQFDFAACFDQYELPEHVRSHYVIRTREEVRGSSFFALTRLPMGARQAPGVAQVITWLSVLELHTDPTIAVTVDTMIDNVRILGTDPERFLAAVRKFVANARFLNLTLNETEGFDVDTMSDAEIVASCHVSKGPRIFLGEEYLPDNTIRNAERNVTKLREAAALMERKLEGDGVLTYRQFASLIGLALFMAHTINVVLAEYFTLLRAYGVIIESAVVWDDALTYIAPAPLQQLRQLIHVLVTNTPVALPVLSPPSQQFEDYDAIAIVDASSSGWGAVVTFPHAAVHRVYTLMQRWDARMASSAHAEPTAALRVLRWIREHVDHPRVAIVTDHSAIESAQRRWNSNFNGFGRTARLNDLYLEAYGGKYQRVEFFFVDTEHNLADKPSRDSTATFQLQIRTDQIIFPSLGEFKHSYATVNRPIWCV